MSYSPGSHVENTQILLNDSSGMPQLLRAHELDREAKLLLRILSPFLGRPVSRRQITLVRQGFRFLAMMLGRRVQVASVVQHRIEGSAGPIDFRIYTPEGPSDLKPGFLWCHGGGFVVGDLDSTDAICRSVARAAKAVVVAVRYRLAPEHDLYAGREDFLAALSWITRHGSSIGIDATRLAIGGDSAGGNIAAAVAQETRRRGGPTLVSQVLVYPATNLIADFPSKVENARGYLLTADFIDSLKPLITHDRDLKDPWLSPALCSDLRELPPALIVTAGFDPIRDDGLHYAAQLRAAGVPVELLHYSGQFHGFLNFDSLIGAARDALARIGGSLARAYHGNKPADCTIEISDQTAASGAPVYKVAGEVLAATFMATRTVRQLSATTVRLLAPKTATTLGFLLSPWWVPLAFGRRAVIAYLDLLAATQTYPQRGASRIVHARSNCP
jgi:acetyl esterase